MPYLITRHREYVLRLRCRSLHPGSMGATHGIGEQTVPHKYVGHAQYPLIEPLRYERKATRAPGTTIEQALVAK